jgi:hypothetical protein
VEDGNASNTSPTKDEPVTITAPPAAAVTIDPQNPLPEASFFWRRVIAMLVTGFACALAWWTAEWLYDLKAAGSLLELTKLVIYGAGLVLTYYFIAPSANELTSLVQSAGIIRKSLDVAANASKSADAAPQPAQSARFQGGASPDSQIPAEAPDGAYRPPSDVLTDLDQDAAPTSRA